MAKVKLNLVVAACKNGGIGINGEIPWRLKKDMAMFKKITSDTNDTNKQNAVIMGKKTWLSIPEKFRPLKGRVNIILSTSMKESPDGAYVVSSFDDAIKLATSDQLNKQVESIHVIGGSSVYKEAMESSHNCRVYLTRIDAEFECDTFLNKIDDNKFTRIENPSFFPAEVQEENNLKFTYEVYEKVEST